MWEKISAFLSALLLCWVLATAATAIPVGTAVASELSCETWQYFEFEEEEDGGPWGDASIEMEACVESQWYVADFWWDYSLTPASGWYLFDYDVEDFSDTEEYPAWYGIHMWAIFCPENHTPAWGTCYLVQMSTWVDKWHDQGAIITPELIDPEQWDPSPQELVDFLYSAEDEEDFEDRLESLTPEQLGILESAMDTAVEDIDSIGPIAWSSLPGYSSFGNLHCVDGTDITFAAMHHGFPLLGSHLLHEFYFNDFTVCANSTTDIFFNIDVDDDDFSGAGIFPFHTFEGVTDFFEAGGIGMDFYIVGARGNFEVGVCPICFQWQISIVASFDPYNLTMTVGAWKLSGP